MDVQILDSDDAGPQAQFGPHNKKKKGCLKIDKADALSVIQQRISLFPPAQVPDGMVRYIPLSKHADSKSPVYSYGIRFVEPDTPITPGKAKFKKGVFFCLASAACVAVRKKIRVSFALSAATTHLSEVHGYCSEEVRLLRGDERAITVTPVHGPVSTNPVRFWLLTHALHAIRFNTPFMAFECEEMRALHVCNPDFPDALSAKIVRRLVVEIYSSTKDTIIESLRMTKLGGSGLAVFHLIVDVWTASQQTYLGARVCSVDSNFNYETNLLAVRCYSPTVASQNTVRAAGLLHAWLRGVLAEFNLLEGDIASSTINGFSDLKHVAEVLLPSTCPWDWGISHFLGLALMEAVGTAPTQSDSHNPEARALIGTVKKIADLGNKSRIVKLKFEQSMLENLHSCLTLHTVEPECWMSLVLCIERVLTMCSMLRTVFSEMHMPFPLDNPNVHSSLVELYSLLRPVALAITEAQAVGPFVPCSIAKLVTLSMHLNPEAPLLIAVPGLDNVQTSQPGPLPLITHKTPSDLQPLTTHTRALLAAAVRQQFFGPYIHARADHRRSWYFDMAAFLTPPCNGLVYVEKFVRFGKETASESEVFEITADIRSRVRKTVLEMMVQVADAAKDAPSVAGNMDPSQASIHASTGLNTSLDWADAMMMKPPSPSVGTAAHVGSPLERATRELHAYSSLQMSESKPNETLREKCARVLAWWRDRRCEFPLLSVVARAVLGKPTSNLARDPDFEEENFLVTSRHNRFDAGIVEMRLFLKECQRANRIPPFSEIAPMSAEQASTAYPQRFKNNDYQSTLQLAGAEGWDNEGSLVDDSELKEIDIVGLF